MPVYVFDAVTLKLLLTFPTKALALKHANVNASKLELFITSRTNYNGFIYSYSPIFIN